MERRPTFSVIHTSARPDKWKAVYDEWIAKADHQENVEYCLCVDKRWGLHNTVCSAEIGKLTHKLDTVWTERRNTRDHDFPGYGLCRGRSRYKRTQSHRSLAACRQPQC